MGEIKKYAQSNVIRVLIGNKKDLEEKRAVTFEEGEQMAKEFGIEFFETSAKETI